MVTQLVLRPSVIVLRVVLPIISMDPLHLIKQEDFPKLKRLLREEFPKSFVVECWIDTRLKWQKIEPNKNAFFVCCPEGNVTDGLVTFGVVVGA